MLAITQTIWQDPENAPNQLGGGQGPITVSVSNPVVNAGPPGFQHTERSMDGWSRGSGRRELDLSVTTLVVSFVVIYQP